jgi:hypothetical protein
MEVWYEGRVRYVVVGDNAEAEKAAAIAEVGGQYVDAADAQLNARLKLIVDTQRVSIHILRHEGDQVYGVKTALGLRGYGWFAHYKGHAAFILHSFTRKSWQKMRAKDRKAVVEAREAYAKQLEQENRGKGASRK